MVVAIWYNLACHHSFNYHVIIIIQGGNCHNTTHKKDSVVEDSWHNFTCLEKCTLAGYYSVSLMLFHSKITKFCAKRPRNIIMCTEGQGKI